MHTPISISIGLLSAGLLFFSGASTPSARGLTEAQSAKDGVYTEAQALRGKEQFGKRCSVCHSEDLGGDKAPALKDDEFLQKWQEKTAFDLLDYMKKEMPQDKPGALTPEAYADLLAYLLQANDFPAGQTELKPEDQALKAMKMK